MSSSNRFLALSLLLFALLVAGLSIVLLAAPEARATTTSNALTYNQLASAATVNTRAFAMHTMQTGLPSQAYGVEAATVTVAAGKHHPPEVINVCITPTHPSDNDHLYLSYEYLDRDGDPEDGTQICWYKNQERQACYEDCNCGNALGCSRKNSVNQEPQACYVDCVFVPADATSVGDVWYAIVTPKDKKYEGFPAASNSVTIENTPPEARDVYIKSWQPPSADNLELYYTYFDADGDPEDGSRIRWYKNGVPQVDFNDQTVVPFTATSPAESWYATIEPHDGIDYGTLVCAPPVRINTPPQAQDVHIVPSQPQDHQSLTVSYTYEDLDNDPIHTPKIRWYRNEDLQPGYNDQEYLPASATSVGDNWYATVAANDGIEYGPAVKSNVVTITEARIPNIYLPIVLLGEGQKVCDPDLYYEENDCRRQACELLPGETYVAYPDDIEDIYYFVLTQTTSVNVWVINYQASEPGQLLVYDESYTIRSIARDPYLQEMGGVPNKYFPDGLKNLDSGLYYVRVYTYDGTFNTTQSYHLTITYY